MAQTTTSTLSNLVATYYDRVLLEALDPKLLFYQFGIKKALPIGEGTSVKWNRPQRLEKGYLLSQGSPVVISAGFALSTQTVSAIIRQYGGYTAISDLADMTVLTDVMKMAAERLGTQAAETIERVIVYENFTSKVNQIIGDSGHHIFKNISAYDDYWGSVSGVSTAVNGSPLSALSCDRVLAVSDLRYAIWNLRKLKVPAYQGNDYIALVNVEQTETIVADTTWQYWHQYTDKGIDNLYSGEIGKILGARVIETTEGPACRATNAGGTASGIMYGAVIFGKGFYGVTELDGGIKTFTAGGAQKADPLNQVTTYGWKANFATKVLNTSCGLVLWTGADTTIAVAAESAGSTGVLRGIENATAY
jgi:N4-gp56 family major capsid protein